MTKKKYLSLDKNTGVTCKVCERDLMLNDYMYGSITTTNGFVGECKTCAWINRRGGLPKIDEYEYNLIWDILDYILRDKIEYVNELCDIFDLQLDEVIYIVQCLKIGNKQLRIKGNCRTCGKGLEKTLSVYLKNHGRLYCSHNCYCIDKPNTIGYGKDNPCYNRVDTTCTSCGKPIKVIPYDYNKKNSYGDCHNFCSQECYWKYRSKYYVGEKATTKNRIFTDEDRDKMRIISAKSAKNRDSLNSKIQMIVNNLLDNNGINYSREYAVKYYAIDNYLDEYGLIIEVMGDYWHTSPLRYNDNGYKINEIQQKTLRKDKSKYTYLKEHLHVETLYIWERDVEKRPELCEKLILHYISSYGDIQNYNSFNWSLDKYGQLVLNQDIIIPYQKRNIEEYRHLFKPHMV